MNDLGTNCFDWEVNAEQVEWNGSWRERNSSYQERKCEDGECTVWVKNGMLWAKIGMNGLASTSNSALQTLGTFYIETL